MEPLDQNDLARKTAAWSKIAVFWASAPAAEITRTDCSFSGLSTPIDVATDSQGLQSNI